MIEAEARAGNEWSGAAEGRDAPSARILEGGSGAPAPARGSEGAGPRERSRAQAYLDLWERHVAGTASRGGGRAGPWTAR